MKTLVELFNKYKCDKGSLKHRYDRVYEPALKSLRNKKFTMLEIGVFKGNSLEAWVDYFPKATFIGLDIFVRVDPSKIAILNHPRVKWFKCDSLVGPTDELKTLLEDGVDVIIDDGLHTHEAQQKTFDNFMSYLKDTGVYFIEDVWAFNYMTDKEKQHWWVLKHNNEYTEEKYNQLLNSTQQYNIKFHDLRSGYDPDTFIIEVRK